MKANNIIKKNIKDNKKYPEEIKKDLVDNYSPIKNVSEIEKKEKSEGNKNIKTDKSEKNKNKNKSEANRTKKNHKKSKNIKEKKTDTNKMKNSKNKEKKKSEKKNLENDKSKLSKREKEDNSRKILKKKNEKNTENNKKKDKTIIKMNNKKENINKSPNSSRSIETEIEKLRKDVNNLMTINNDLISRLEKLDDEKQEKIFNSNVINFAEEYDGKVNDVSSKFLKEEKALNKHINKQEENFQNFLSNYKINFSEISSQVKSLTKKVLDISDIQNAKEANIQKGIDADRLIINHNLNVKGVTYAKKIKANEIDLENIQLKDDFLKIKENTRIIIDNQSFDVKNISKIMHFAEFVKKNCGDDLELCNLIYKEQDYESEKQKEIIEGLKMVRFETNKIIKGRGNKLKKEKNFKI